MHMGRKEFNNVELPKCVCVILYVFSGGVCAFDGISINFVTVFQEKVTNRAKKQRKRLKVKSFQTPNNCMELRNNLYNLLNGSTLFVLAKHR